MIDLPYSESTTVIAGLACAIGGSAFSVISYFVTGLFGMRFFFKKLEPGFYPQFFYGIPFSLVIGMAIAFPGLYAVYRLRNLDLDKVSQINIHETNELNGKVIGYSDTIQIKKVLLLMGNCRGVEHEHDELYDGYVIKVIMDDGSSSDITLTAYRKSTVNGSRKAVILRYGGFDAGEFNCPAVQDWVARNIDPLYGRKPAN